MSGRTPGLVSTVIAVYNRQRLMVDAIESVLAQSYRPIEIVVVDDGSTDESGAVGRAYAEKYPGVIRYVHQENQFCGAAWNRGIRESNGEFLQFLDSDDLLLPEKFATQVAALRAHPDCGISYCYIREYVLGEAWSGRPARSTAETHATLFPHLLTAKIWPSPAPFYRREVIDDNGWFLPVRVQPDWEYESRAAARGVRLHHCKEYLGETRGTHRQEGRPKGGTPRERLPEYALVLERILAHARQAAVPPRDLDRLSKRLFATARRCAAEGFEAEARRLIALAADTANTAPGQLQVAAFRSASDRFGWSPVGRLAESIASSAPARGIGAASRLPRQWKDRWRHRAVAAAQLVSGEPITKWPALLNHGWSQRRSRRVGGAR